MPIYPTQAPPPEQTVHYGVWGGSGAGSGGGWGGRGGGQRRFNSSSHTMFGNSFQNQRQLHTTDLFKKVLANVSPRVGQPPGGSRGVSKADLRTTKCRNGCPPNKAKPDTSTCNRNAAAGTQRASVTKDSQSRSVQAVGLQPVCVERHSPGSLLSGCDAEHRHFCSLTAGGFSAI